MPKILANPPKIEIDFTDAYLTGQGGWALLARAARELDLPRRVSEAVRLMQRDSGASDCEILWSLVASLSARNGALSDLDALRVDPVGCELLGLRRVPSGCRLSEYPSRFGASEVDALHRVAHDLARQPAPTAIAHEFAMRGYVQVFVDGSAIEEDGALFEGVGKGYDGTMQYLAARGVRGAVVGQQSVASRWRGRDPGLAGAVGSGRSATAGRCHADLGVRGQRLLPARLSAVLHGAGLGWAGLGLFGKCHPCRIPKTDSGDAGGPG